MLLVLGSDGSKRVCHQSLVFVSEEEARLYNERKLLTEEICWKSKSTTGDNAGTDLRSTSSARNRDVTAANGERNSAELKQKLEKLKSRQSSNGVTRSASFDSKTSANNTSGNVDSLPKFKLPPKFSKFSKKRSSSMDSDKENESDKRGAIGGAAATTSGIRRSRAYEKLLKEQLKMKSMNDDKILTNGDVKSVDFKESHVKSSGSDRSDPRDTTYRREHYDSHEADMHERRMNGDSAHSDTYTKDAHSRHARSEAHSSGYGEHTNNRSSHYVHRSSDQINRSERDAKETNVDDPFSSEYRKSVASRDSDYGQQLSRDRDQRDLASRDAYTRDTGYRGRSAKETGYCSDSGFRSKRDSEQPYERDYLDRYHSDGEAVGQDHVRAERRSGAERRGDERSRRAEDRAGGQRVEERRAEERRAEERRAEERRTEERRAEERRAEAESRDWQPQIRTPLRTNRTTPLSVKYAGVNRSEHGDPIKSRDVSASHIFH